MDASELLACFSQTLEADQAVRSRAEAQLRSWASSSGFLAGCFEVVAGPSDQVAVGIKKAAAVYIKNHVMRSWSAGDRGGLPETDKNDVRSRLLAAMVRCDHPLKHQLLPVLRTIVAKDYPERWPQLLPETSRLLREVPSAASGDDAFLPLHTGALAFAEIVRRFRWLTNSDRDVPLRPVLEQFPHLLAVGTGIVENAAALTEVRAEIVKLVLKAYKFAVHFDLPSALQQPQSFAPWGELHGRIINTATPAYVRSHPQSERALLEYSKMLKWSVANLTRIFSRYASESLSRKFSYPEFTAYFCGHFLPHLMQNYLAAIDRWCHHRQWLPGPALYHIVEFLAHLVTQPAAWPMLEPHAETLVGHLVFPMVCATEETLETFESDPHEYIHVHFDVYDEFNTPDIAALGLLSTLVLRRKKAVLEPAMAFIGSQLTHLQGDHSEEAARKKDGVFRMVGTISHIVSAKALPFLPQMEPFLAALVVPELESSHMFLRARALEVVQRFADLDFQDRGLVAHITAAVLANAELPALPVRLEAALAIQAFLHQPEFKTALEPVIVPTMLNLLALSAEIDSDAVAMVMQECVESYSQQLQPFGVELMTSLTSQLLRLVTDTHQAANTSADDYDDFEGADHLDKVMAAVGLLNTMITVLLSFENLRHSCIELEQVFAPAIEYVLANVVDDYFGEVAELMENLVFLLRAVSPAMWRCFSLLYGCFQDGHALMYIEELSPCLQNFILYGKDDMARDPQLAARFFDIYRSVFEGDANAIGIVDLTCASEWAQTLALVLQAQCQPYTETFVISSTETFAAVRGGSSVSNNGFDVETHNVVLATLVYDTAHALQILQARGALQGFLDRWLRLVPQLRRVYDVKLSVLAVIAVSGATDHHDISAFLPHLGRALAVLAERLPLLVAELERKRKSFTDGDLSDDQFDGFPSISGAEGSEEEQDTSDYLQFLDQENAKLERGGFYGDEDNEVVEDPLATNPLEAVDVFAVLRNYTSLLLAQMQTALFSGLSGSQRAILEKVVLL